MLSEFLKETPAQTKNADLINTYSFILFYFTLFYSILFTYQAESSIRKTMSA
jgi:hypothetical protein